MKTPAKTETASPAAPGRVTVTTIDGFRNRRTREFIPAGTTIRVSEARRELLTRKGILAGAPTEAVIDADAADEIEIVAAAPNTTDGVSEAK